MPVKKRSPGSIAGWQEMPPLGILRLEEEDPEDHPKSFLRYTREPRLAKVWARIFSSACRVRPGVLENLSQHYRCIDETGLQEKDRAAVALFQICFHAWLNDYFYDSKSMNSLDLLYNDIASSCAQMRYLKFGPEVEEHLGSFHPSRNNELANALDLTAHFYRELRAALTKVGGVGWNHQERGKKLASADDEGAKRLREGQALMRGRLTAMIDKADTIFDPPLVAPLAAMAGVFFRTSISTKTVENCRASLHRHRSPKEHSNI